MDFHIIEFGLAALAVELHILIWRHGEDEVGHSDTSMVDEEFDSSVRES